MHSIIANADFEYKVMKLADLRKRIIDENNFTTMDILKMYHEKSDVDLKYSFEFSKEQILEFDEIRFQFEKICTEKIAEIVQEDWDAAKNEKFNAVKDEYDKLDAEDTLEDILSDDKILRKYPADFRHLVYVYQEFLNYTFPWCDSEGKKACEIAINELNNWAKTNLKNTFKFNSSNSFRAYDTLTLPSKININKKLDIDFNDVYAIVPIKQFDNDISLVKNSVVIEYNKTDTEKLHVSVGMPEVLLKISEVEAKRCFDDALSDAISQNNTASIYEYVQNLEAQPITVNMNSKTSKCELIDGFKRLLYTTNKELLDTETPIRVFSDLDDTGYIALLYAANYWKSSLSKLNYSIYFHDRGFLFALKTRFGFELPSSFYEYSTYGEEELEIFEKYDDIRNKYYISAPVSLKEAGIEAKPMEFFEAMYHKKHLISDVNIFYNDLYKIMREEHGYDLNIAEEIARYIVYTTGIIRRLSNSDEQNALTCEMIEDVFNDKTVVKNCAKKHLTTNTYVQNHLEKKDLYKHIKLLLAKKLVTK